MGKRVYKQDTLSDIQATLAQGKMVNPLRIVEAVLDLEEKMHKSLADLDAKFDQVMATHAQLFEEKVLGILGSLPPLHERITRMETQIERLEKPGKTNNNMQ